MPKQRLDKRLFRPNLTLLLNTWLASVETAYNDIAIVLIRRPPTRARQRCHSSAPVKVRDLE